MKSRLVSLGLAAIVLGACSSSPEASPDDLHGRGVVITTETPPEGAEVFERPTWSVGDRFVMRVGGQQLQSYRVTAIADERISIQAETGGMQRTLDLDLCDVRWAMPDVPVPQMDFDPVDKRLTWPMWVGKRWTCHYYKKSAEGANPVLSEFHCDTMEDITVPAGTFRALRVWCKFRPATEGNFYDRWFVYWYAPDLGRVILELQSTLKNELVSVEPAH